MECCIITGLLAIVPVLLLSIGINQLPCYKSTYLLSTNCLDINQLPCLHATALQSTKFANNQLHCNHFPHNPQPTFFFYQPISFLTTICHANNQLLYYFVEFLSHRVCCLTGFVPNYWVCSISGLFFSLTNLFFTITDSVV